MRIPVRHQIRTDETVLSWIARSVRMGGYLSERHGRIELLGGVKARLHPYLPAHLGHIAGVTGQAVSELRNRHSLYRLFWGLGLDPDRRVLEAMKDDHGDRVIMQAGLPHAKLHFFEGLKYCQHCVKEDRQALGFGYFKVPHQIPGIEACPEHECLLRGLASGDYGYDRHLPLPPHEKGIKVHRASQVQVALAAFSTDILDYMMAMPQSLDYRALYRSVLAKHGLVTTGQRIRQQVILQSMQRYFELLPFGGPLGIPAKLSSFAFVGPLLRLKTHYPCHPIKHLLFTYWLFKGDVVQFMHTCEVQVRAHRDTFTDALVQQRVKEVSEEALNQAVEALQLTGAAHPTWRRQEIKAACARAYFLLYHHDRERLEAVLPPKQPPIHPQKDWAAEDRRLVSAIKELNALEDLSLSEIEYRVNGRGYLRKSLSQLPQCQSLLQRLGKIKNIR